MERRLLRDQFLQQECARLIPGYSGKGKNRIDSFDYQRNEAIEPRSKPKGYRLGAYSNYLILCIYSYLFDTIRRRQAQL